MAGRNRAKLEDIRASLAKPGQDLSDVTIVEADVTDAASLNALAASAAVVITMVGPYAQYGRPVVQVKPSVPSEQSISASSLLGCWASLRPCTVHAFGCLITHGMVACGAVERLRGICWGRGM